MNFCTEFSKAQILPCEYRKNDSFKVKVYLKCIGIIHLVRSQNFLKNLHFVPLIGRRTSAYQGVRNVSFPENFANVLNE